MASMEKPNNPEPETTEDNEILIVDMDESEVRLSHSKGRRAAGPKSKAVSSVDSRSVVEHKVI